MQAAKPQRGCNRVRLVSLIFHTFGSFRTRQPGEAAGWLGFGVHVVLSFGGNWGGRNLTGYATSGLVIDVDGSAIYNAQSDN